MNSRIARLWQTHPFALLTEISLFLAFALSIYVMATLETVVSAWAMVPNVLGALIVATLVARHRLLGRPAMYWSHLDGVVVLLFLYFLANIYYSEIRAVSWQTAALYLNSLAAYFLGRLMFYHRVRAYVLVLTGALVVSWFGLYTSSYRAKKMEQSYRAKAQEMIDVPPILLDKAEVARQTDELFSKADYQAGLIQRYQPVSRVYLLFICFWGLSLVFLWLEKPTRLAFLVYGGGIAGLYVFYAIGRLAWALGGDNSAEEVLLRTAKFESLRTAVRIFQSYPIMGSGLGTFPSLFDAYRLTTMAKYGTGFSAYLYCAVETGLVGVLPLLYFFLRLPLHTMRRWKLFPNRRLRFAIWVHLLFFGLFALQGFFDADLFQPAVWFPAWACIGTFVSLVLVRDPVRVFELLLPAPRTRDPQAANRRVILPGSGSGFGRTPLAKLPRARASILKRLGISQFIATSVLATLVVAFCALEAVPYVARKLTTPAGADNPETTAEQLKKELASQEFARNLNIALKIFPLDSNIWSALASHFEASIAEPLEIYKYSDRIESAYTEAIAHNPYRPELYEKLYFLYRDINRQGDALDIITKGVETNPNQLILRLLLVRELERLGNYPLATWHIKQALFSVAPHETELYLRLAELYEIQGLYDDAKLYYLYARQIVPPSAQTSQRLDRLKGHLGM